MHRQRWSIGLVGAAVILGMATVAQAEVVWTFDCSLQGWGPANHITMTWEDRGGGKAIYVPTGTDPHGRCLYTGALAEHQYLRFSLDAGTQPVQTRGFVYFFTEDGHAGIPFDLVDGENIYTIDLLNAALEDDGGGRGGETLSQIRLDLPQGSESEFVGHEFVIDWAYMGMDNTFVPTQDTVDCSQGAIWRNLVINRLDVAPAMDGVVTPAEYPTTPLILTQDLLNVFGSRVSGTTGPAVDDADLSGTFYIAWDATYLYCAAQVSDNTVVYNGDQGEPLNVTDGIQLLTDHLYMRGGTVGQTDGLLIHDLVPGQESDNNTAAYYQHWPKDDGSQTQTIADVANDIAGRTVAGGYEVEMRIPWANFTPSAITPQIGTLIGYVMIIMDFESADLHDLVANSPDLPWAGSGAAGWNTALLKGPQDDLDSDGLTNDEEELYGTDPEASDTDGDGLTDYEEIAWDGDDSAYTPGLDLDPLAKDTDGDGYPDGLEARYGTDPLDANDTPPPMPATSGTGLWVLGALMLGAVAFTLVARRRARNHS